MPHKGETYWKFLKRAIRRPDVAYALAKSTHEHRRVEKHFRERLAGACPDETALEFPHLDLPPGEYWQLNFFSILFLSMFSALGMPADRRRKHGLILHAVRGLVTSADNILDSEDKGSVRLRLDGGTVLPDILLVMLQHGIARDIIAELTTDEPTRRRAQQALVGALFDIAREESSEEDAVETALPPDDLLANIHSYRGGRLLQLAFVVPQITEPERAGAIAAAGEAVHQIGLGLQVLDDITDFHEDVVRRNHNMLRSWVVHRGPDGLTADEALLDIAEPDLAAPERTFPAATRETLGLAVNLALDGFGRLHALGHVIDRSAAPGLIETMFRLRGLGHLWALYVAESGQPAYAGNA